MTARLFLTGPVGCGKTTMLRTALGEAVGRAGGFVTERIYDGDGAPAGFELMRTAELAKAPALRCGRRFLSFGGGAPRHDDSVFTEYAVKILRESAAAPFAVLDEFGGFELTLPDFEAALYDFLASGLPTIGVLKAIPSAKKLGERLGLWEELHRRALRLEAALAADPDTAVLRTTGRYDEAAKAAVSEWVRNFADK
ncbi:MAG TPA: nucleoside-triphosphatase [Candidatus Acidoferrum sp.]|nr:nucleoside-triphosphatase [Candidatus Acidoferrum sp.]